MKKLLLRSFQFLALLLLVFQVVTPLEKASALTTDNILPPSNLSSQLLTPSDVKLSWSSVYGATGYNVYGIIDGQLVKLSTTTSSSYTFNNLQEGSYTYVVSTLSSDGESGPCPPITVNITYPDMTSPQNLTSKIQNGNDVVLNWTTSQYAKTYNIYKLASDGQKTLITSATSPTYTMTNTAEGNYTYKVSAVNPLYGESPLSNETVADVVFPVMTAPSNPSFSILNGNDISLKWSAVNFSDGYKVYQIIDGEKILKDTVSATNILYTNMPASDYVYEIHSYSDRFGESQNGTQISFNLTLPTIQAPDNLTYTITNGNDITLKWSAVQFGTNYKVYQIIDGQKTLKSTLSGTSVTYSNMPSGDYSYEIYSYNDRFGESQNGSEKNFTLVTPQMEVPASPSYTVTNGNDITLKWSAVPYVTNYKVYQIIDGQKTLKSTLSGTSVTYSNMPAGDYSYEIYSYSSRFGESSDGSSVMFTLTLPDMEAPSNLVQTIKNASDFTLSWEASPYASGYKVYQIINGQKVLKSTVTGTTVSYTNMPSGEYTFEVHSYSARFGESIDASNLTFTLNGQIMEAPTNLNYSILNGNDIKLSWTAAPYATSYKIYLLIDGQPVLQKTVTTTSVTFANMPEGDYSYIVNSVSKILGESPVGAEMTFSLIHPVVTAPANLAYKLQNGNDIILTWSGVTYANSYNVYELIDGQLVLKANVTTTAATLTNASEGSHTYVVKAVSTRFGESEPGSEVSLSVQFPEMLEPGSFAQSIANGNDITLRWNAVTYASAYNIYQIVDGQKILIKTVTGTSASFVNMPEGDYVYEVNSFSSRYGESINGSQLSFTLTFPVMLDPGSFTQSIVNGNDIKLSFAAVPYATNYKIYQIIDGQKVLVKTVTGTSFTFANMPEGDYLYEIHSFSSRFGESVDGSQTSFSLVFPAMQSPANLTDTISKGNDITFKWTASPFATNYKVYQIIDGQRILVQTVTGTSVTFTNMPEGDYSYEVSSYSIRFGESEVLSKLNFSLIWPVVQAPTLNGTVANINNVTLSWQSVSWANEYRLYEIIDGNKVLLYKGTALSFKLFNISEGTHAYHVTAYSTRFGESELSSQLTENIVYPDMQSPTVVLNLLDGTTAQISWNFIPYANGYNIYEIIDGKPVLIVQNLNNLTYIIHNLSYANHEYYVTAYSNSFGESDPSTIVLAKLIVDTEAPITTASAPSEWTNQSAVVTLTAADGGTGVAGTYYSINDGAFTEGTSFTLTEEGIYKISYYSIDKMGNIEAVQTIYVKIDKSAPAITMDLNNEYKLGSALNLNYTASDALSGIAYEKMVVFKPGETTETVLTNGSNLLFDKPGTYRVLITVTDAAGNTYTLEKEFVVYIPATIEVTSKVINNNNGVFTVRVDLPSGLSTQGLDLNTAKVNGVSALNSNNGYYNQAKLGQFKFNRSDFNWTTPEMVIEFRCYINGYLVIGQTTVKVQK